MARLGSRQEALPDPWRVQTAAQMVRAKILNGRVLLLRLVGNTHLCFLFGYHKQHWDPFPKSDLLETLAYWAVCHTRRLVGIRSLNRICWKRDPAGNYPGLDTKLGSVP